MSDETITVKRLPSGWFHVRGRGPCNWAQSPCWPCDEQTLREHAFPEASEAFIREAVALAVSRWVLVGRVPSGTASRVSTIVTFRPPYSDRTSWRGRRNYQCPGCFSRCELLPPGRERSYECDCGEALTCTDLRGDDE